MKINRNSSTNNSYFNNIEQSQSNSSYLARKINAPDEVSFSSKKGKKANTNVFQRLWSGVIALALSFSLNGCTTNTNNQQNIENKPTKPQTTVSEEDNNPIEQEIKIEDKSFFISDDTKIFSLKDSSTKPVIHQQNVISSFPKTEVSEQDVPQTPVIPDEEIMNTLPKYAPPPEIPEISEEEGAVVKYAPPPDIEDKNDTPHIPEIPEEEGIVIKYAPPPAPIIPEEETINSLPKYAPPPDVVE